MGILKLKLSPTALTALSVIFRKDNKLLLDILYFNDDT